jgi:hypothetical protein
MMEIEEKRKRGNTKENKKYQGENAGYKGKI